MQSIAIAMGSESLYPSPGISPVRFIQIILDSGIQLQEFSGSFQENAKVDFVLSLAFPEFSSPLSPYI